MTQVTSKSSSHLLHACQTPSLSSGLTDLKPQARLQETARGKYYFGPIMANEEPCLAKASEGAGSGAGCRAEWGGGNIVGTGESPKGRAQTLGCGEDTGHGD